MEVFTAQIAAWRTVTQHGVLMIDSTVKSGMPILAPTWDMVLGHKRGIISDAEYKRDYVQLLTWRIRNDSQPWEEFMTFHYDSRIAIGCYCPPDCFCHRLLLAPMLGQLARAWNIPFTYPGEIRR